MTAADKIFKFLAERPGNLSACAKEFGTTREKIQDVLDRYPEKARAATEAYLDEIAEQVYLSASGAGCRKGFKVTEALKLLALKRPKEWGGKVVKDEENPDSSLPNYDNYVSNYVLRGESEFIEQRPIGQPGTTVIRVEDAPGRFFEDSFERGAGTIPVGEEDRGDGLCGELRGDVSGEDSGGDGLG